MNGRIGPLRAALIRLLFATGAAAFIIAGMVYALRGGSHPTGGEFDANFFALMVAALLPSMIYLVGVKLAWSSVVCGGTLIGITFFGWIFVFVSDTPERGLFTFPAFFSSLALSVFGVIRDRSGGRPPTQQLGSGTS